jgi:hypothetical protein
VTAFSRPDPFAAEQALLDAQGATNGRIETLAEMGAALLEIAAQAALAKGVALPARQLYYPAPIAADCEQVAALFSGWTPSPPPDGPTICQPFRWLAGFSLIITRCTPKGAIQSTKTPPKPEAMIEVSQIASADAEVLLEVVTRLDEIGSDISVVANPPSGGFQTVELNVQLLPGSSF